MHVFRINICSGFIIEEKVFILFWGLVLLWTEKIAGKVFVEWKYDMKEGKENFMDADADDGDIEYINLLDD